MINWEECSDVEVAALVKALHEARFADEPNDPLVWQSPIVIDLHVQALTEQQRRVLSDNGELEASMRRSGSYGGTVRSSRLCCGELPRTRHSSS